MVMMQMIVTDTSGREYEGEPGDMSPEDREHAEELHGELGRYHTVILYVPGGRRTFPTANVSNVALLEVES